MTRGGTETTKRERRAGRARRVLRSALAVWLAGAATVAVAAGSASPPDPALAAARRVAIEAERQRTADQLASIAASISLTKDGIQKLDTEIASVAADRERIRQSMIDAAAAQKAITRDVADTEKRIDALAGDEAGIKVSLREKRGLLAEVIGALERMGRKPPPALLVKPDDALGSVRSAILLGAVVPGIRTETEKLASDLEALAKVRREIGSEKERFVAQLTAQREEETRLTRLLEEKQKLEADGRERRAAESARVADLASRATSLQELIQTLETDAARAREAEETARVAAAEAARRAETERLAAARAQAEAIAKAEQAPGSPDERDGGSSAAPPPVVAALPEATPPVAASEPSYDIASLRRDMERIEPAAAFSTMKGRLSVPVAGEIGTRFGDSDGGGRPSAGMSFRTQAGNVVTAPSDGQILYSGPFRSYGELLILDAGDGYHVVLAGMGRADVEVGQFVLAGEPVAVMGAKRVASVSQADFEAPEPALYVEFRKDGKPVDPSPWWAGRPSGRTRNDS